MVRQARGAGSGPARKRGAAAGSRLAELARGHAEAALDALVEIAVEGGSEAARISAANAILDRAYGKPGTGGDVAAPGGPPNPRDLSDDELIDIASAGGARAAATTEGT